MLSVIIKYTGEKMFFSYISTLGFSYDQNSYRLALSKRAGGPVVLTHQPELKKLILQFPKEVTMEDCKTINEIITSITNEIKGDVDDQGAHIGYDKHGKEIYIYHGFYKWSDFINKAKHRSLEGHKVSVLHGENELGEGILLTYERRKISNDQRGDIVSCTLITKEGEQSFYGEAIEVIPITQW
ncbi:hypothetical protein [Evansella tamaricis]|uniref:Uncharacterized protein n=1 Tax=Evansella tamaricis TaxID=2069301 RepID=A0ABS6JHW0_9BACI|nr:hypothetical protein [Evansella tamaricis]MBU9713252.1 hypothetical protein [Evansella tamaricis]